MLESFNRNQGVIAAVTLIFSLISYFFNKRLSLIILIALFAIILITYITQRGKPKKFNDAQKTAKILFIDDKECQIVTSLSRNNFDVKKINDVASPATDTNVQWANIIFVDYKDVGKKLFGRKEGLGLIAELKRVYGNKKRYIIYSSVQDFGGLVDFEYIRKNASYDEFISLITTELAKL